MQQHKVVRALALGLCASALGAMPAAASAHDRGHGHARPWWWHPPVNSGVLAGGPGTTAGDTPGAIAGVEFDTLGAHGVTDASGRFRSYLHAPVRFAVGNVTLGTSIGDDLVTPFALSGDRDCTQTDDLGRELQFLEAIDADGDPTNGVTVAPALRARAARRDIPNVRVANLGDAQLARLVQALTGSFTLPDRAAALDRFHDQVDAEQWQQTAVSSYANNPLELLQILTDYSHGIIDPPALLERQQGLIRSQGITSDGSSLTFSWQFGLTRTATDGTTVLARNTLAIPPALSAQGGNHIGDVDEARGKLYAPIEDGDKRPDGTRYLHPMIAVFDAKTLQYTGEAHELPQALHTEGVPWVAVDTRRGVFYTAEWNNTKIINVFDLRTFALVKTITLSRQLGRIQGAKMLGGMLYAYADLKDVARPVYKIDPDTGHVLTVDSVPLAPGAESEGMAFVDTADGPVMNTVDVAPDSLSTNRREHELVQPSLRSRVCEDTRLWG